MLSYLIRKYSWFTWSFVTATTPSPHIIFIQINYRNERSSFTLPKVVTFSTRNVITLGFAHLHCHSNGRRYPNSLLTPPSPTKEPVATARNPAASYPPFHYLYLFPISFLYLYPLRWQGSCRHLTYENTVTFDISIFLLRHDSEEESSLEDYRPPLHLGGLVSSMEDYRLYSSLEVWFLAWKTIDYYSSLEAGVTACKTSVWGCPACPSLGCLYIIYI